MRFPISELPTTGIFISPDQFVAYLEGQKCIRCNQRAVWLPHDKGIGYCDEHFPYHEEKKDNYE